MSKVIKSSQVSYIEEIIYQHEILQEASSSDIQSVDTEEQETPAPIKSAGQDAELIMSLAVSQAERIEEEAKRQAEALIRNAQDEAKQYLNQANSEATSIKENAFQEGYLEGNRTGKDEAIAQLTAKMEPDINSFNMLLKALGDQMENFLLSQDTPMLELVLAMAEKILGTTIAIKPELIQRIIENVLAALNETGKVFMRVNPIHIPYLNDHGAIFDGIDPERLIIEEDPQIKPGDCHIETEIGFLEINLDEQMEILKNALREENYYAHL